MAMNFPDSPSNGDTVTLNGKEYTYTAAISKWSPAGGGSASIGLSDTAPVSPSAGDLWYNTANGTMSVYYNDGSSSQWVGTSGVTGATGATGATGSTTVVTNPTDLPISPADGTMGYVTSNNKLYIYNGTAWYVFAGTNEAPTISGLSAAYDLATDGTATVITMSSTDPEGLPVTFSSSTIGLGSIATVSQSNNVFTITPSTDVTDAGNFTLVITGTDGVNVSTATSTITWPVILSATGGDTVVESGGYKTHTFTSSGIFTVTNGGSIDNVIAIGGGGAGGASYWAGGGGGGGGLGSQDAISVLSGQQYTVQVGSGGVGYTALQGGTGSDGGDSYFVNTSTVSGGGGSGGVGTSTDTNAVYSGGGGGGYVGQSGGNGGSGGNSIDDIAGGGGGAGGYSGNGGDGGTGSGGGGTDGSGGGAGGGGAGGGVTVNGAAPSGGGVGTTEGTSGTGGTFGQPGTGGSGGATGSTNQVSGGAAHTGGLYGGGGGGQGHDGKTTPGCNGGSGIVIIRYAV